MEINTVSVQPSNPSNEERHALLRNSLRKLGRLEDFNNIIRFLSPPPDILDFSAPGKLKNIKVGIIGGGLAGMAAAFELRKLGCHITVFDALEDRVGGRVYTYYFGKDRKHYAELGPMRVPVSHETTWHYINTFGLHTEPFARDPNAFVYVNSTRVRNNPKEIQEKIYPKYNLTPRERNTPWDQLYDYASTFNMRRMPPQMRSEILRILPRYSQFYNQLINMSIRQNFEMLGLSADAINMIGSIDGLTGAIMDLSYNEVLQDEYAQNFTNVYRISGGFVHLPLAFYRSLSSKSPKEYAYISENNLGKVTWRGGNWVTGIYQGENGRNVILKYKNKNTPKGMLESFDYVICTIPFSTLYTVDINPRFSNRKMQAIREINYINGQKTLLYCKRRFWEENTDYGRINGGVSTTDLIISSIVYPSDHVLTGANPCEPGVLVGSYNINKYATHLGNMKPEQLLQLVKRQVEKVHGLPERYLDSIVAAAKYINWNDEPWFRGALAFFSPGQKRIFSHAIIRPEYNNRVFFAGEHTSATHAWMQGSLHSGKLAANDLAYYAQCEKNK